MVYATDKNFRKPSRVCDTYKLGISRAFEELGAVTTGPRYAIYYAPEPGSPLHAFGQSWFTDAQGASVATSISPERIQELSENSRRYGFHGTLKPPFGLNPASSLESLLAAARIFARTLAPIELPPLELAIIGKFIALTPITQSAALEKLAAACVRAFEAFRAPLTHEQLENYKLNRLTVHQEQMLENWGYPYVMEEFRFHISVTDRIEDSRERYDVVEALERLAAPILGKPITVRELTVFSQSAIDEPMIPIERIPFGRGK